MKTKVDLQPSIFRSDAPRLISERATIGHVGDSDTSFSLTLGILLVSTSCLLRVEVLPRLVLVAFLIAFLLLPRWPLFSTIFLHPRPPSLTSALPPPMATPAAALQLPLPPIDLAAQRSRTCTTTKMAPTTTTPSWTTPTSNPTTPSRPRTPTRNQSRRRPSPTQATSPIRPPPLRPLPTAPSTTPSPANPCPRLPRYRSSHPSTTGLRPRSPPPRA